MVVPKAFISLGTSAAGIGLTLATGGLATPAFVAAAAATGAATGTVETLAKQGLDVASGKRERIDGGDVLGAAFAGGAFGAGSAGLARAMAKGSLTAEQDLKGTGGKSGAPMSSMYKDSMSAGRQSLCEADVVAPNLPANPSVGPSGGASGSATYVTGRSGASMQSARSAGTFATAASAHSAHSALALNPLALADEVYYQGFPSEWADIVRTRQLKGMGPDLPTHNNSNPQLGRGLYASRDRAVAESYAQNHGSNGRLLTFKVRKGVSLEIRDVTDIGKDVTAKRMCALDPSIDVALQTKALGTMDQTCFRTNRACAALELLSVEMVKPRPIVK
mmetsp:Transcript_124239/g.397429  ORF Transcript_124239/g.397429 Transcript_124239/m.397429 type:complete len:334 (-) Transcript_124239:58-1059(-)